MPKTEDSTHTPDLKPGERIQYACGHYLVAGSFGIQGASVADVPKRRCAACDRRLRDAAPDLLAALEQAASDLYKAGADWSDSVALDAARQARAAIAQAKETG